MESLLCHSGMFIGSIVSLGFVAASVGGIGLLAASVLRRKPHQTTNG